MRRLGRALLVALAVTPLAPASAGAVVGGQPADPATVPWFASVAGCGGTLVAPDRVLTAGHCVAHRSIRELGVVAVGAELRRTAQVALHPAWRRANGRNVLDDVALVQLDAPVAGVAPVAIGSWSGIGRIVGAGRTTAPGSGAEDLGGGELRTARLRTISDAACARAYRTARGNGGERFDAARMLCATDVDGRSPLSSGCNGDSGGPLVAEPAGSPVLLGVVSWGGARCGADRLPNVFADASRYRRFVADPAPVWAPLPTSAPRITGSRLAGGRLTCTVAGYTTPPRTVTTTWQRQGGRRPQAAGHGRHHTVTRADRGHILACGVEASGPGGIATAPFGLRSAVRIPR